MGEYTRRRLLSTTAGIAGLAAFAGCTGTESDSDASSTEGLTAQASFFVFGDFASQVAGDAATADTLVPIGQHGHGWEPGPRVREAIRNADLFTHGVPGFQPWADDVLRDLEEDEAAVATIDVSSDIDLLEPGEHDHANEETHEGERAHGESREKEHDRGEGKDPHFWTDPLRAKEAVNAIRQGLADVDAANAEAYAENAAEYRDRLDDLHDRTESLVADASKNTVLLAGHDAFQYFGDRYGVEVEALTNVSPDDRSTPKDIERAQEVVGTHDLRYICADPLESQRAAEQLVTETGIEAVLPLTAMPGLKEEWDEEGWGYLGVMENVNLPTLERALDA